jgi:glycosyltransferase involved in cell wall biosynthesis
MKKNYPLVSVIIPTRNSAQFLDICLSSIKNQTYKNIEILISDNDSSDNTKYLARTYGCIFLNTSKPAPQVCLQRNLGAKKANGEFLFFLDHDMEFPTNFLNNIVKEIFANPLIDAWYIPEKIYAHSYLLTKIRNFENKCSEDTVVSAARLIKRKKFFSTSDLFDLKLSGGPADWDMDIQLKKIGCEFKTSNQHINHHEENLTLYRYITKKAQYVRGIEIYIDKWYKNDKIMYNSIVKKQFDPLYRSVIIFFEKEKWKVTLKNIWLYFFLLIIMGFKGLEYFLHKTK